MSKCDTMKPGDVLRLRDREGELGDIVVKVREVEPGRVKLDTDADMRWIIAKLPVGMERNE